MAGITLSRGSTSITLEHELDVERATGRPNSELRSTPSKLPKYIDKNRSASDVFEISGQLVTGTPEQDAKTLIEDIIEPPLGRGNLTLDFGGLYALGSYDVVPTGGQAGRISYSAGEKGIVRVSGLTLQVVNNA